MKTSPQLMKATEGDFTLSDILETQRLSDTLMINSN